ncbi:unnamed protein product [Calypogeia fissa]
MATKVIERCHEATHGKKDKDKKRAGKLEAAAVAEEAEGMDRATSSSSSKPKVGLLVLLSLVSRMRPEAVAEKADTMLAFLTLQNPPILAWVYGQAAQADVAVGMALWVQNLLPLATGEGSNHASKDIALQFMENVLLVDAAKARKLLVDSATKTRKRLVLPAALET